MNPTHPRTRRTHGAPVGILLVVAALSAVTTPLIAAAEGPPGVEGVVLSAPTGSRSGVPLAAPGAPSDAASIAVFDTYGRDPALAIGFVGESAWSAWEVIAVPVTDPSAEPLDLATGVAEAPIEIIDLAPPPVGEWLVSATLDGDPSGSWGWHLLVPDRTIPEELPTPDLVLFGGGQTHVAERGSGCYLRTCGDIGGLPPDRSLPLIRLGRPDEPVFLTLSDGSGMVRASATALRLNVDETAAVDLLDPAPFTATNVLALPAPPGPGRWRLELSVSFSDGRGSQAAYARVDVP